ncbi:MAG: hypothetical protein ACJAV6_000080 [Candidatus Paceibacteria bacterium]|jgi:hypothetical protein
MKETSTAVEKELDNLLIDMYCYLSEDFDIYSLHLEAHTNFIKDRVIPDYGSERKNCPPELKEEYKDIKSSFLKSLHSIKKELEGKGIDRYEILKFIKFSKNKKKYSQVVLLDTLQCIENSIVEYKYRYHAFRSMELTKAVLNARESFIKSMDFLGSQKEISKF